MHTFDIPLTAEDLIVPLRRAVRRSKRVFLDGRVNKLGLKLRHAKWLGFDTPPNPGFYERFNPETREDEILPMSDDLHAELSIVMIPCDQLCQRIGVDLVTGLTKEELEQIKQLKGKHQNKGSDDKVPKK